MQTEQLRELARRLSEAGLRDHETARICGRSIETVRRWRDLDQRAAGLVRPLRKGHCPVCRETGVPRPEYAYLLGPYLGDGHLVRQARDVYRLEIACCDDWPGLIDAAAAAVTAVMPASKVGRRQRTGCTCVGSYSRHWPCLFPQHGPGMKHTRKIELVPWQQEIVDEFTEEFVRGLIHSDGCRGINKVRRKVAGEYRRYEYPRYFFSNTSADIRRLYTDALDRLGIAWKQSNARNISVAKREAVARLDEFVGPKY
ncbi:helix-turn-helix domain-containing protein [Spirillospora sp. NPDC127200]